MAKDEGKKGVFAKLVGLLKKMFGTTNKKEEEEKSQANDETSTTKDQKPGRLQAFFKRIIKWCTHDSSEAVEDVKPQVEVEKRKNNLETENEKLTKEKDTAQKGKEELKNKGMLGRIGDFLKNHKLLVGLLLIACLIAPIIAPALLGAAAAVGAVAYNIEDNQKVKELNNTIDTKNTQISNNNNKIKECTKEIEKEQTKTYVSRVETERTPATNHTNTETSNVIKKMNEIITSCRRLSEQHQTTPPQASNTMQAENQPNQSTELTDSLVSLGQSMKNDGLKETKESPHLTFSAVAASSRRDIPPTTTPTRRGGP